MTHQPVILIVDDEPAILHTVKAALEDEGFFAETLSDGGKAIEKIGNLSPDLVLLDIFLPNYNGLEILAQIKKEYPTQKVIIISGFGTIRIAMDAAQRGAYDFIEKPFNLEDLLAKLAPLKQEASLQKPILEMNQTAKDFSHYGIIGTSTLFCELMHHVALVAPLNLPILIYGPSGCGKALLANYIHNKSIFAQNSLLTLICAESKDIPESILKHEGSLFFKNIHELNADAQRQLLVHLEKNPSAPPRIIASSSPQLFQHMQQGLFNRSLFCKLNVTPIEVPAITKRRYDIPLLVDYFLRSANEHAQKTVSITSSALRIIRNYEWSGDIAQIKLLIESIVKLNNSDAIVDRSQIQAVLPASADTIIDEQCFSRFHSLDEAVNIFQQRYLAHLLKTYRYDTQELAEFLKISVAQLHNKMIELNLGSF